MRSCEYTTTTGRRKTKKLCVKDILFYDGRREIKKTPENLHLLHTAKSVSVTFTLQKNNQRYATITQQASSHELDPVQAWADVVSRILNYSNGSLDSPVDFYVSDSGVEQSITAKDVSDHLKAVVRILGKDYL